MKFKNYRRQYERVFTGTNLIKKKCDLDKLTVLNDFCTTTEFINKLTALTSNFNDTTFDFLVKYYWLTKKFCYRGYNKRGLENSGIEIERAFGVFMRSFVGFENRTITRGPSLFSKIIGYIDDFFPGFDSGNPFNTKYEYPFKYINLACLFTVYQLEERMELLRYGESEKMSYIEFSDYMVNYVNCYNEEHGEDSYVFAYTKTTIPYIKCKKYGRK